MFDKLLYFLQDLDHARISYSIEHNRAETVMVIVRVPGYFWEIEFFEDGNVEIEIFESSGEIYDMQKLKELYEDHFETPGARSTWRFPLSRE